MKRLGETPYGNAEKVGGLPLTDFTINREDKDKAVAWS